MDDDYTMGKGFEGWRHLRKWQTDLLCRGNITPMEVADMLGWQERQVIKVRYFLTAKGFNVRAYSRRVQQTAMQYRRAKYAREYTPVE